jgi:hypothetical protein
VLLAWDAEVNMWVDEGGQCQHPLAVHGLGALDLRSTSGLGQLGDLSTPDDEVASGIQVDARVEEAGAADDQVRGLARTTDKGHAG